jgi:hypothetical protein
MRTTINLYQDVYEHATLYAKGRGVTLSKAVCELARKGIEAIQSADPLTNLVRAPNGLLIFKKKDRVITTEMVKAALEEDY